MLRSFFARTFSDVIVENMGFGVANVIMNKKKGLNGLSPDHLEDITQKIIDIDNSPEYNSIILSSKIKRMYSPGADLKSLKGITLE
jgi:enoyl-CoA hydratase/carnithine racemase